MTVWLIYNHGDMTTVDVNPTFELTNGIVNPTFELINGIVNPTFELTNITLMVANYYNTGQ